MNAHLAFLVTDDMFQADMRSPLTAVALALWKGASPDGMNPLHVEAAKHDPAVSRTYPRLRVIEQKCNDAGLRFPIELIEARGTELPQVRLV